VYPILGANRIELAAKELSLCDYNPSFTTEQLITLQLKASVGRNQIVTFSDMDRKSLNDCTVNDNIMDFWMLWISRNLCPTNANIAILTTHFYTELVNRGVESVTSWRLHKTRDLFSIETILFPVNEDKHWSLCAIYHVNKIPKMAQYKLNVVQEGPFLMHLDSLKLHSSDTISRHLRDWLNYEWKKRTGMDVNILTFWNFPLFNLNGKGFVDCFFLLLYLLLAC